MPSWFSKAGHSSAHCTPRHADHSPCFPATEARLYQTPLLTKKDARFCVTSTRFCQIVTAPCSCSLVLRGGNQGSGCTTQEQRESVALIASNLTPKNTLWQVRRRKLRRCPRPFCFERKTGHRLDTSKNTIFQGSISSSSTTQILLSYFSA